MTRARPGLHGDERAVVMAEFLVVFFPIVMLFLATIELSRLAIAELMLQRAAGKAARACAVIQEQPLNCDINGANGQNTTEQKRLVSLAAQRALEPMKAIAVSTASCQTTTYTGIDTVTVNAEFYCAVPMVRGLICSAVPPGQTAVDPGQSSRRAVSAVARYGHQGARYNCDFADPRLWFQ